MTERRGPLGVGLIGVGMHAQRVLIPTLELVPEMRLVALATGHAETARAAEERYRVVCHVGIEALVRNPAVEVVLAVGCPHGAAIRAALDAGKPVWCETPTVGSAADLELLAHPARGRVVVQAGYCLRYTPVYQKVRALLAEWHAAEPGPRFVAAAYYPAVHHYINLLLMLLGPITHVRAAAWVGATAITLRFAGGDGGTLVTRRLANLAPPYERLELSTEQGILLAEDGRRVVTRFDLRALPAEALSFEAAATRSWDPTYSIPYAGLNPLAMRGYVPQWQAFVRCVRDNEAPLSTLEDAAATFLVRDAVRRALESDRWEEVAQL
jgi:predicted dehydrogenase